MGIIEHIRVSNRVVFPEPFLPVIRTIFPSGMDRFTSLTSKPSREEDMFSALRIGSIEVPFDKKNKKDEGFKIPVGSEYYRSGRNLSARCFAVEGVPVAAVVEGLSVVAVAGTVSVEAVVVEADSTVNL